MIKDIEKLIDEIEEMRKKAIEEQEKEVATNRYYAHLMGRISACNDIIKYYLIGGE